MKMPKRRKTQSKSMQNKLFKHELCVSSSRIFWLGWQKRGEKALRLILVFAVLATVVMAGRWGLQKSLVDHPDFKIRTIDLEANGFFDHSRLKDVTQINPSLSIFEVSLREMREKVMQEPDVISVTVERKLPGTIAFQIQQMIPVAWIECSGVGVRAKGEHRGLLIDQNRNVFRPHRHLREVALGLPVLSVEEIEEGALVSGQKLPLGDLERALSLLISANALDSLDSGWQISRVEVVNAYSLRAFCEDGLEFVFGMHDHQRELRDMLSLRHYAQKEGLQIRSANFIPFRNIPVTFVDDQAAKPLQPKLIRPKRRPTRQERDLQEILNRG